MSDSGAKQILTCTHSGTIFLESSVLNINWKLTDFHYANILHEPIPTTKKTLLKFIHIQKYYAKFVPNKSEDQLLFFFMAIQPFVII